MNNNSVKFLCFCLMILYLFFSKVCAQESIYYFYNPENNFGSEKMFNPFSVLLNGGFDILRNGKASKDLSKQYYKTGASNVSYSLLHPIKSIEKYGWRRFLTSEVFPVSTNSDDFQYFPNYANHMIGHGMKYVKLSEWYDWHGIAYPKTCAVITSLSYAYLNEVIENGNNRYVSVDAIADMLIFNPLGILLFSFEWTKNFFSQKLPLYDWSLQPVYNPFNNHLENTGEQYVLNYIINPDYAIFFYWGTSGILGLTYALNDKEHISFGIGGIVNKLIEKNKIRSSFWTRYVAPETIDGAIGAFYDINHSLLSSLIITGPFYYNTRLNIYPGLLKTGWFSPGFFIGAGELDRFQIGITAYFTPVGLNYKF